MAIGDVYRHGFDEDVPQPTNATCPECDGQVTTNARETVCDDCGLVIKDAKIDHGAEWRSYDDADETKPARTGAPLTPARHDRGLSTRIGRTRDANGNELDAGKRRQLGRLRREHQRAVIDSKQARNLKDGCCEIRRLTAALGLGTSLRDHACQLFRTAQAADLLPGRSIEAMAAASILATCRCHGLPRTRQEFGRVAQVSRDRVANAYDVLNRELSLPAAPVEAGAYVKPFASRLELSDVVRRQAETAVDRLDDPAIATGRNPAAVAAAALYLAARDHGRHVTQAAVADVADVSAATVRARRDELVAQ